MRHAIGIPNLREYADPNLLVELARRAEDAGWDGVFLWDHMAWRHAPAEPAGDPWIALAAIAAVTTQIRIGNMVCPLARRRPWKVARECVTLDQLSGGRFHLGVGLGAGDEAEFGMFGDSPDRRVRAEQLDEGLEIITALWGGEPVHHRGTHYVVDGAQFTPTPMQAPRIPIWVAGRWPNTRPFRRAARFDGAFPTFQSVGEEDSPPPAELGEVVGYVAEERAAAGRDDPYDVIIEGLTPGRSRQQDAETVATYAAEGLTWWIEKVGWFRGDVDEARRRIGAGPPAAT